ncbi:hypothetical protein AB3S75_017490 [Citrus x aurantiifolia]
MWNAELTVQINSYSRHHIDFLVQNAQGKSWRGIGIYEHPQANQKKHTWTLLRRLAGLSSLSWLCFGDFNEILSLNEKTRGLDRSVDAVGEFREAVRDCSLIDLGSRGYPFTWSNRQFGPKLIEEKLDSFFCNQEWRTEFF